MYRKIALYSIFITLFVLFNLSCNESRVITGWGQDGDIHVLADSTIWNTLSSVLSETFEKPIITPQNEIEFTLIKTDIETFKRFKNLIFLATLDSNDPVSDLVKSNLSSEAMDKVRNNESYLFMQKEKWASEQVILFLVAPDVEQLKARIQENEDGLYKLLNDYWLDVIAQRLYHRNEQKELSNQFLEKYGWTVRVPYDYEVFISKPDSHFIMLRRMLPERWLFVYWEDSDNPSEITPTWILEKRDKFGKLYYEGDMVEQKFVQPEIDTVNFLDHRAIYIKGLWRNDSKEAGGPFRSYSFYNESDNRIYMLDYAIFQPRLKDSKRGYLRQAEVIMRTFQTRSEIEGKQ
ncbi:DUF4837 family protein [candidate division KSB1 bacterium]|nr:DUF4837 family protein [candidate division KSB1 bacterium]